MELSTRQNKGRAMEGIITKIKKYQKRRRGQDMYNKKGITEILKEIKKLIPEDNERNLLIGENFNARIGTKGQLFGGMIEIR